MDLSVYTVQQLKDCLSALKEHTSGNKNELMMRLSRLDEKIVAKQLANVASGSKRVPTDNLLDVSINESTEVVNSLKGEINALKGTVEALVRQMQLVVTDVQRSAALSTGNLCQTGIQVNAATTSNATNEDRSEIVVTETSATSSHANITPTNAAASIEHMDSRANYQESSYAMQRMGQQQTVKEIASILPDFDPGDDTYTSVQFIERIEQLNDVYGWNDAILLFAVLGKLKGAAKRWADAQPVFRNWRQFVVTFTNDFPCIHNKANTHIIMMNMKMGKNEKIIDYYYRMLALGRRDAIDDASIIQYIINGLQDFRLKQTLCVMKFNSCSDLLKSISSFASSFASQPSQDRKGVENSKCEKPGQKQVDQNNHVFKSERNNANRGYNGIVCFNCRNRGHISRNCPQARRNQKPSEKINNITNEDASAENDNEAQINAIATVKPQELLKEIIILENDPIYVKGLMDSGSAKSLIKQSIADKCKEKATRCNSKLTGFAGGSVVCVEMKHLNVKIDNVEYGADFLVIEDKLMSYDILIGLDILSMGTVLIKDGICQMMSIKDTPIDIGQELTDSQIQKFYELIDNFSDTFGEKLSELGKAKNFEMEITVKSEKPINKKPYFTPFPKRELVEGIINELLELDIIRPSESAYASPIILVRKQNGEERMCVDYRELNAITEKQPWSMPTVDGVLSSLNGNCYFTTLDLMSGYYQIGIKEESKHLTAFITYYGHFEHNRMAFGLRNAPCVFQKMINKLIAKMKNKVVSYVDEIIIATKTVEENLETLQEFLEIMQKEGLTLRISKCSFLKTSATFLGHEVDATGIKPGDRKTRAILEFPKPKTQMEVRRFLGLAGFFRKFVPKFAHIAKPLTDLTKKTADFVWSNECEDAFQKLITNLTSKPVLAIYDMKAEHQLHTDASSVGIGAILMQLDKDNAWHPVAYFSRCCNPAERNYGPYELEVLAVVEGCERFRMYLLGKFFHIVSDCQAISTVKLSTAMVPRIARWFLKLAEYDYEVVHRPGEAMRHVDALSRAPVAEISSQGELKVLKITTDDWVATLQCSDEKLKEIIHILKGNLQSPQKKQIEAEFVLKNHRLYHRVKDQPLALVVPKGMRWRLAKLFHDDAGHVACEGVLKRMVQHFWFPRMRNFVKSYIKSCLECVYHKEPNRKQCELFGMDVPRIPFEVLHLDHLGPFVKSRRGNEHILVCVDALTRYVILVPTKSTSAKPVVDALNQLTLYFGLPRAIVTDRGSAFTSSIFSTFCKGANIQHIKVAVRTPRANGLAERVNQSICSYLKTATNEQKHWDDHLRMLQWSLNTKINTTTTFAPLDLIFDFPLRDISGNKLLAALHDDVQITMNSRREEARENIEKARIKWKARFDAKHAKPKKYNEGDLVVIDAPMPATGDSRKLLPKYKGPYVIDKVLRFNRYVVQDIDGHHRSQRPYSAVLPVEKLKPWCELFPDVDDLSDDDLTRDE